MSRAIEVIQNETRQLREVMAHLDENRGGVTDVRDAMLLAAEACRLNIVYASYKDETILYEAYQRLKTLLGDESYSMVAKIYENIPEHTRTEQST